MSIDWNRVIVVSDEDTVNVIAGKTVLYVQNGGSGSGGGGSVPEWGDIAGTLSNQSDLQSALNGKASFNHNHDASYAAIEHDHNSLYYRKGEMNLLLNAKADEADLGSMAYANDALVDGKIYGRKNLTWVEVPSGGSAVWGDISGTLSNQTDLNSALNSKLGDAPSDNKTYGRKNGQWSEVSGGSGGSAVWGDIEGTLSDQTDLQDALDAKADSADLGDMAAEDDAPSDDKTYGRKNGEWTEVEASGGSVAWGDITGTLSNQSDLNVALASKVDYSNLKGMAFVNDAPSNGNSYARKNGVWSKVDPESIQIRKIYDFEKGSPVVLPGGSNVANLECDFGVKQSGSGTPSSSNIRPFVGFSFIMITVFDGQTRVTNTSLNITKNGQAYTVYGAVSQSDDDNIYIPYGHIASYAGETLPGNWWSDRDVQSGSNTPTTGAEVVYELATPEVLAVGTFDWPVTSDEMTIIAKRGWDTSMSEEDQMTAYVLVDMDITDVLGGLIAPSFDPTASYAVDDYVVYECVLFRFIAPHTGVWNQQHVTRTTVMAELVRLTS